MCGTVQISLIKIACCSRIGCRQDLDRCEDAENAKGRGQLTTTEGQAKAKGRTIELRRGKECESQNSDEAIQMSPTGRKMSDN